MHAAGCPPVGFSDRRRRPPSAGAQRREAFGIGIEAIHGEVKARDGSPRIHAELITRGQPCCVNTVARLMREQGIAAKTLRKFCVTTDSNHDHQVAENLLTRQFEPQAPNRGWTADITYVATGEGWWSLAAVEDLHTRRIVGWSMPKLIDIRLVVDTLEMAIATTPRLRPGGPLGSGQPVRQRALPAHPGRPRDHLQHEPPEELLGKCPDGERLRLVGKGADPP
uniref:IS3 family transposase n=1 Tax=Tautonia marina TaxID=2653855 RepID=UPI0012610ACE|nr:IS3 family transposase [Tautonia marina]